MKRLLVLSGACLLFSGITAQTVTVTNGKILTGINDEKFQVLGGISAHLKNLGIKDVTANKFADKNFASLEKYYGVRYANTPTRFERTNINSETADQDCTQRAPICYQASTIFDGIPMSEDCLTLDVYKPKNVGGNLPVKVWIHGGGFNMGSALEYDGSFLAASQHAIVVVIQYRLGVLGFFNAGNYGLWDMRLSLEWVEREISRFGGNPNNVHILGESAGGAAMLTQLHHDAYLSNNGRRQLFNKVSVMSGGSLRRNNWSVMNEWENELYLEMMHDSVKAISGELSVDYNSEVLDRNYLASYVKGFSSAEILKFMQLLNTYYYANPAFQVLFDIIMVNPAAPVIAVDNSFIFGVKTAFETYISKSRAGTLSESDSLSSLNPLIDGLDLSGYEITYGTLNGDGDLMFSTFQPKVTSGDVSFKDFTARNILSDRAYHVMSTMEHDCYQHHIDLDTSSTASPTSCLEPVYSSLKNLYKSGNFNEAGLISEISNKINMPSEMFSLWLDQAATIRKFNYEYYSRDYYQNLDLLSQQVLHVATDNLFTNAALLNMAKDRELGGRVNGYHLAHGYQEGNRPGAWPAGIPAEYQAAGYSGHADDVFFLFGASFCPYTQFQISCEIKVKTGGVQFAGTDSNIVMHLDMKNGDKVNLPFNLLPADNINLFQQNQLDTFQFGPFGATTIRYIDRVTLSSDGSGAAAGWNPEYTATNCSAFVGSNNVGWLYEEFRYGNEDTANGVFVDASNNATSFSERIESTLPDYLAQGSDRMGYCTETTVCDLETTFDFIDFVMNEDGHTAVPDPWGIQDPLSVTMTQFGTCGRAMDHPHFHRSTLEMETNLIPSIFRTAELALPIIPDCAPVENESVCCGAEAQSKWQEAYDLWMADHVKWQSAFENYKDEL